MKVFVIAEVATTWLCPDWNDFAGLVKQCAACGVQAVKIQWVSDPHSMERRRKMPALTYSYLNWPQSWMKDMAQVCADNGVEFMCTAYLSEDVTVIDPYVQRHKVASLEAGDPALIEICCTTGKQVFVSMGVLSDEDAWRIRHFIPSPGAQYEKFPSIVTRCVGTTHPAICLQCTAGYPTPVEQLNLLLLKGLYHGLSDHTANVLTGALAVAAGARVIEVHVRHDLTPPNNPDFGHSLTTAQLKTYVDNVRLAERALGDGIKKIEECEEPLRGHRVIA